MRFVIFFAVLVSAVFAAVLFLVGLAPRQEAAAEPVSVANAKPVLVELFTSQGCSSCPPADRLLKELSEEKGAGVEVITLAFHVDYWNYLGWKDKFSSADFSRRQEAYAERFRLNSSYTPQMVADGSAEFVGNNRAKAAEVIAKAASKQAGTVNARIEGEKLFAKIELRPGHADATVLLAVAESKLFTTVGSGENSGSTLEHTSVVRSLTSIGRLSQKAMALSIESKVPRNSEWKSENLKHVIFVQENATLKILAAGTARR